MDAKGIEVREKVSASRKLDEAEARKLARAAERVLVAKGKTLTVHEPGGKASAELVRAMLGPTGNLRAPVIRVGKTLVVGFHEAAYAETLL